MHHQQSILSFIQLSLYFKLSIDLFLEQSPFERDLITVLINNALDCLICEILSVVHVRHNIEAKKHGLYFLCHSDELLSVQEKAKARTYQLKVPFCCVVCIFPLPLLASSCFGMFEFATIESLLNNLEKLSYHYHLHFYEALIVCCPAWKFNYMFIQLCKTDPTEVSHWMSGFIFEARKLDEAECPMHDII